MGRKRFITDSYPVVKKREGPPGHSKGELAPELGEDTQSLSQEETELELLRQFDLAWQYGPCTGITRLQRWHRAEQMGLKPPLEVCQVLKTHPEDPRFQCRLSSSWHLLATKNFRTDIMDFSVHHPIFGEQVSRLTLEVFRAQLLICLHDRLLKLLGT